MIEQHKTKIIKHLHKLLNDANWNVTDVVNQSGGTVNDRAIYRAFADGMLPIEVVMELAYIFGVDTDEILQQNEYIAEREDE